MLFFRYKEGTSAQEPGHEHLQQMNLRESLLEKALGPEEQASTALAGALQVLNPSEIRDAEASATSPASADPELVEALARSDALSFSKTELAVLKGLNYMAIQSILSSGEPREKIAAAKLVVLMQKIERDSYLELRSQSRKPSDSRTLIFADPSYLGKIAAAAAGSKFSGSGSFRVVSPEKDPA